MAPPLLFSTAAFFARPLGETFALIADCGYSGVEVMVTRDPASQDPDRIAALADRHGLRVGALHAPCLLVSRRIWGTDPLGKIERSVEVARRVGAPLVVMHPPYRWQGSYRRWVTRELGQVHERTGVIVAIENMFPIHVGRRPLTFHANQDLDELDGIAHLVLDTSHAAVARHDLVEVRRRFGPRLHHVHLSDNAGKGWDSHLPPGEGTLPLTEFLDDLAADAYAGSVSLEVDLRGSMGNDVALRATMVRMREQVEARLGV